MPIGKTYHTYSSLSDTNIDQIKKYISKKSPLTYEEQLWIFRKSLDKRTEADELKLIDSNLAMVFKIAANYWKRHKQMSNGFVNSCEVPFSDLFQAGVQGLQRAIKKFDSRLEMRFSTYGYYWIEAYTKMEIRRTVAPMKTQAYADVKFSYIDANPNFEISTNSFYSNLHYNDLISGAEKILDKFDFVIFKLYFIDEIDVKNIAPMIKRSGVTVYNHVKNIRKTLIDNLV